jgi:hypothetical protein
MRLRSSVRNRLIAFNPCEDVKVSKRRRLDTDERVTERATSERGFCRPRSAAARSTSQHRFGCSWSLDGTPQTHLTVLIRDRRLHLPPRLRVKAAKVDHGRGAGRRGDQSPPGRVAVSCQGHPVACRACSPCCLCAPPRELSRDRVKKFADSRRSFATMRIARRPLEGGRPHRICVPRRARPLMPIRGRGSRCRRRHRMLHGTTVASLP